MTDPAGVAVADAQPISFWLDDSARPDPAGPLIGSRTADLAVIGGGYSGLWTALLAKERFPSLDVALVEARECGWAASGRNGGFCSSSLTHGLGNGVARFPGEIDQLERFGARNISEIEETLQRHRIVCEWERTGELNVATAPWQVAQLRELAELAHRHGHSMTFLDSADVRAEIDSPTYLAGIWDRDGTVMVHPTQLAWGLRRACLSLGVRIYERSRVLSITDEHRTLRLRTAHGELAARRVALATNAFPPLLRRLRLYLVPVYDYALMTQPLTPAQLDSIGWRHRQGVADAANQFHYYRLTGDNRILWGGYDAIYRFGGPVDTRFDQSPTTFRVLAQHFLETFPQLEGLRFTHRWGGVIDTCTRFCCFWDTAYDGKLALCTGFTGLGVGATRFGAQVMLDILWDERTERTELDFVRKKPLPFPPEPLRYASITLTRWSLDRADRRGGQPNSWLRTLDRLGLGFGS